MSENDFGGHTPGPWTCVEGGQPVPETWGTGGVLPPHIVRRYIDEQGRRCTDMVVGEARSVADARLIAAAPYLLEERNALRAGWDACAVHCVQAQEKCRALQDCLLVALNARGQGFDFDAWRDASKEAMAGRPTSLFENEQASHAVTRQALEILQNRVAELERLVDVAAQTMDWDPAWMDDWRKARTV